MGANISSVVRNTVQSTVNSVMTNIEANLTSDQQTWVSTHQEIDIAITGKIEQGGSVTATNDGKTFISSLAAIKNDITSTIVNQLTSKLQQTIDDQISQKNSGINIGQFNGSQDNATIMNEIMNAVTTSIATNILNKINVNTDSTQKITFTLIGDIAGAVVLTNTSLINTMTSSTTDSAMTAMTNNSTLEDTLAKYKLTLSQTNEGLSLGAILMAVLVVVALVFFLGKDMVKKIMGPLAFVGMFGCGGLATYFFIKKKNIPAYISSGAAGLFMILGIVYLIQYKKINAKKPTLSTPVRVQPATPVEVAPVAATPSTATISVVSTPSSA